jgi:hypothetical protein
MREDASMESASYLDPHIAEVLSSPWALYQRLLHLFLAAGTLGYVPTVAAVVGGLRCHAVVQAFLPAGSPIASTVCSGHSRGVVMGLAVLSLVAVVVGFPLLYLGVLVCGSGRQRFRDLFFWRRYGMLYVNFVDSRYG